MLLRISRVWIWAGINPASSENFNPIRIVNIVSLLFIGVLLLQVPLALRFWQSGGLHELAVVLLTISLLTLVPLFNQQKKHTLAKLFLIALYAGDILLSCLWWRIDLNIQYFLLLGIFVCPFCFSEQESALLWLVFSLYCTLFIGLEFWFQLTQQLQSLTEHQQLFSLSSASLLALASVLCSYHIWRNVNRSWRKLAQEKRRSETLLLNILPATIAHRLKSSNTLIADYFEQVSILFADIQNFTPICKHRPPQAIVALLNEVFCIFDVLSQKYCLEKIKTNGDGYMAGGGLPETSTHHAIQCCECAIEMHMAFQTISQKHTLKTGLRIGIGSGEVVAGVIGKNKFTYDMWGEAVNLASRMESQGQCDKTQVTQYTYEMAKHKYQFQERGKIQIKGIGMVNTYWLLGKK
ncbi:MAG: adenylate cyclase [Paraglaciecola sp.]|jgi:adenylate cyclase